MPQLLPCAISASVTFAVGSSDDELLEIHFVVRRERRSQEVADKVAELYMTPLRFVTATPRRRLTLPLLGAIAVVTALYVCVCVRACVYNFIECLSFFALLRLNRK